MHLLSNALTPAFSPLTAHLQHGDPERRRVAAPDRLWDPHICLHRAQQALRQEQPRRLVGAPHAVVARPAPAVEQHGPSSRGAAALRRRSRREPCVSSLRARGCTHGGAGTRGLCGPEGGAQQSPFAMAALAKRLVCPARAPLLREQFRVRPLFRSAARPKSLTAGRLELLRARVLDTPHPSGPPTLKATVRAPHLVPASAAWFWWHRRCGPHMRTPPRFAASACP